MNTWLTPTLKEDIKKVFEPRYKRPLSSSEISEIANNLTEMMEGICKFKWKKSYENP